MRRIDIRDGGWLHYDAAFLSDAQSWFDAILTETPWKQERGRFGFQPRLTAWYADDGIAYSYSGVTHIGLPWTPRLCALKMRIEDVCKSKFNSVLLNRYRDGRDSMGWHADNEEELGLNPVIASISLGGVRRFRLKHLTSGDTMNFELASGSLLIMGGTTQHHWHHSIPKTAKPVSERINLTYRWTQ